MVPAKKKWLLFLYIVEQFFSIAVGNTNGLQAKAGETVQGLVNPQLTSHSHMKMAWHDSFSAPSYGPNFYLRRLARGGNSGCNCIKDDCGCIGMILAAPG